VALLQAYAWHTHYFYLQNNFGYISMLLDSMKEKLKLYLLFPFLILTIALFIHSREYTFDFSIRLSDYLYTSWLFNYDFGFMKRGLIGQILHHIQIPPTYKNIRLISIFLFLFLFYFIYLATLRVLNTLTLDKKYKYTLLFCFMLLPFTTTQLILEISRFDQIAQLLVIIFLFIITQCKKTIIPFIYLTFSIVLLTLIHEAALIIFSPLMISLFYLNYKNKKQTYALSLLTIICIILISIYGTATSNQIHALIQNYKNYKYFSEYAVRTTSLSIKENILLNLHALIQSKTYIAILIAIVVIIPFLNFIYQSFNFKKYYFFMIVTASPLLLSVIAFDYFRWISLFLFNLTILCFYLILTRIADLNLLQNNLIKYKKYIVISALIGITLGPFGITELFPHFAKINQGALSDINTATISKETLDKLNWSIHSNQ